jgi:hypothetical protein
MFPVRYKLNFKYTYYLEATSLSVNTVRTGDGRVVDMWLKQTASKKWNVAAIYEAKQLRAWGGPRVKG